jgi:hypothetical protein
MGYSLQHRFHSRSKRAAVPSEGPGVKAGVGEDEMGVVGGVGSCLAHWTFDVDVLRVCFFLVAVFDFVMGMGNGHVVVSIFWQAIHFFEDFVWLTRQQENCLAQSGGKTQGTSNGKIVFQTLLDATDGCPIMLPDGV